MAYVSEAEYEDGFDADAWDAPMEDALDDDADELDGDSDAFDDGEAGLDEDADEDFDEGADEDFDEGADEEFDEGADEDFDEDADEDFDEDELDEDSDNFDEDDDESPHRPGKNDPKPLPGTVDPNPFEKPLPEQERPTSGYIRRFGSGVGACTGRKLKLVRRAFREAHFIVELALKDMNTLKRGSYADRAEAWNYTTIHHPDWSTLGYWFGEDLAGDKQGLANTIAYLWEMIARWELAFRKGFYFNGNPVVVRCKDEDCVGGGNARHLLRNTIEFCDSFFDEPKDKVLRRVEGEKRIITTVHEMGHWLMGTATQPRDERSHVCAGGWNVAENMCYRDQASHLLNRYFEGGNPRALVTAKLADSKWLALNNVDNYVSWMWNRYYIRFVEPGRTYT